MVGSAAAGGFPEWIRRAVCYEVPVPAFADSDGDGIGDLPGLAGRLDHLQWLGVDCLWLTGSRGTPAELASLLDEAHGMGIRVVADLPVTAESALAETIRRCLDLGMDGFRFDRRLASTDRLRLCRTILEDRSLDGVLLTTREMSAPLPRILRALREESSRVVSPLLRTGDRVRGLRARRPARRVDNDRKRLELCAALLLSLPGLPVIYYGDEIGMAGHDRALTPMQWNGGRNAGFSDCPSDRLLSPLIADSVYGYRAVNVESQRASQSSLLNWLRRMIALRRDHPALARGVSVQLRSSNSKILAYLRHYDEGNDLICVYNLSAYPQAAELDLSSHHGIVPVESTGSIRFPRIRHTPYQLTLPGYGFYWLCVERADDRQPALAA